MNILFICRHNRFRSKVAEAIAKNLTKNIKHINIKSAGIKLDTLRLFIANNVLLSLKEKNYPYKNEKPRKINEQDIIWADKIIIVADNVSKETFPKEKTEVWEISDTDEKNKKEIKEIMNQIEDKVKELLIRLNVYK